MLDNWLTFNLPFESNSRHIRNLCGISYSIFIILGPVFRCKRRENPHYSRNYFEIAGIIAFLLAGNISELFLARAFQGLASGAISKIIPRIMGIFPPFTSEYWPQNNKDGIRISAYIVPYNIFNIIQSSWEIAISRK